MRSKMNNLLQPDSAKKNFFFQFAYQFVILVMPMIMSPYLTRTLGGTALGIYSYTYSIAYYFVVFAMLGINKYGQRIISQRRSDIVELRKTFWSLFIVHFLISCVAVLAYVVYVFMICQSDIGIAFVQSIYVASAAFDITWLFYGLEKFKTIAIRNVIIRVTNMICIFTFVKSPTDVAIYTIIMAVTVCVGQVIVFPQVFCAIPPIKFTLRDTKEHIRPLLTLFAAAVAATLYTVFDKTLLGLLGTKQMVGYYDYSEKIINIPKTFITIVSTMLYPKACQFASVKNYDGMYRNIEISITVTSLLGFATSWGLLAIAEPFSLLYYGNEFSVCGEIISLMCPLILVIGFGETIRTQYIYPLKMDLIMVKILSLNAIINFVLSASLIPFCGMKGAVIGTITAELTGFIIEIYLVKNYISLKCLLVKCIPFAVSGAVMYAIVKNVGMAVGEGWGGLCVQTLVGGGVYCLGIIIYMYFFRRELCSRILKEILYKERR